MRDVGHATAAAGAGRKAKRNGGRRKARPGTENNFFESIGPAPPRDCRGESPGELGNSPGGRGGRPNNCFRRASSAPMNCLPNGCKFWGAVGAEEATRLWETVVALSRSVEVFLFWRCGVGEARKFERMEMEDPRMMYY